MRCQQMGVIHGNKLTISKSNGQQKKTSCLHCLEYNWLMKNVKLGQFLQNTDIFLLSNYKNKCHEFPGKKAINDSN